MIAAQLAELIGSEQVSADAETLAAHRFDRWCLKHWQDWQGEALDAPACVVRPRDKADVQAVVRFAAEHNVPIVPWGLGSGVCGGICRVATDTHSPILKSRPNRAGFLLKVAHHSPLKGLFNFFCSFFLNARANRSKSSVRRVVAHSPQT